MIMLNLKNTPMPLLIKNYADAFGIKVRMQGTSAYTNGKLSLFQEWILLIL